MEIKDKIKSILIEHPYTRNSDTELWIQYIIKYYKDLLVLRYGDDCAYIRLDDFRTLGIGKDTLRRARQRLQQEYPELQATERVKKGRKEKEKEFRNEYGTNPFYK